MATISEIRREIEILNFSAKNTYVLTGDITGYGLDMIVGESGQTHVIYKGTKKNLYNALRAIIEYRSLERRYNNGVRVD
jgi:hypothetical protein